MTVITEVAIAKIALPATKALLTKLWTKVSIECVDFGSELSNAFFNSFSKYMESAYERNSYFSSLVFPNQQMKLKDFYLPLTLVFNDKKNEIKEILIDNYPGTFLTEKKDILVVDTAGMGKSTILKYMFLQAIELNVGIPIFLELRKLSSKKLILDYIYDQLVALDQKVDKNLIIKLLESGGFVFFLDGYDEITDTDRVEITSNFKEFKQRANKNIYIISTREQVGLSVLSDFFRVNIRPLKFDEAENLILKYSKNSAIGTALINKIKQSENLPVHEFLTNPLLVSLLYKSYEYKQTIPLKKHVFYRQVYEALFENHDISKDGGELTRPKLSGLDIHSFEIVMRALGYQSLQTGKVEYQKDELLLLIEKVKTLVPTIGFNPQALIYDLTSRVPLFVVDGNSYRWNHKSLQEYFAALYVSAIGSETQSKIIGMMYQSKIATSYLNFFSLFADINSKAFRHIFNPLLINELLKEFSNSVSVISNVDINKIYMRRRLKAFRELVIVNQSDSGNFSTDDTSSDELDPIKGLDYFDNGIIALTKAECNSKPSQASHIGRSITVLSYFDNRFVFIQQLSKIRTDIFTTSEPSGASKKNDREIISKLGFTAVTNTVDCLFNAPDRYSDINNFLYRFVVSINFDEQSAFKILKDIEAEIEQEKNMSITF